MSILAETRAAGLCEARRKLTPRQTMIIEALRGGPMTAPEVADKLGFSDLNAVKPRLHELMEAEIVRTIGRRRSTRSRVPNTIYMLTEKAAPGGNDTQDGSMRNNSTHKVTQERGDVNVGAS